MPDTVMVDLSKPRECAPPRVSPVSKPWTWVVVICPCRFIHCHAWVTLVGDVDGGEAACMGARKTQEIDVPSSQLCCEPQMALKKIVFKKWLAYRELSYTNSKQKVKL